MAAYLRRVVLIILFGLLATVEAMATVPSTATSTCPGCGGPGSTPPFINIVGFTNPTVAAFGPSASAHAGTAVTITIRDFAGNPIPNAEVALNIAACAGLKLCTVIPSGAAAQSVVCPNIVKGTTNALGLVTLQIAGAGTGIGSGPSTGCAQLVVTPPGGGGPTPMASLTTVIYDPNGASGSGGANGLSAADFAAVRLDVMAATTPPFIYRGRSDYSSLDGCGGAGDCLVVSALDLAYFRDLLKKSTVPPLTGSGGGCPDFSAPTGPDFCP